MARAAAAREAVTAPRPILWPGWVTACSEGRGGRIRTAIAAGMDVNNRDPKVSRASVARACARASHGTVSRSHRGLEAALRRAAWGCPGATSRPWSQLLRGIANPPQTRWTGIHYAAKHGRVGVIDILLDHGANVDAKSKVSWMAAPTASERWSHAGGVGLALVLLLMPGLLGTRHRLAKSGCSFRPPLPASRRMARRLWLQLPNRASSPPSRRC